MDTVNATIELVERAPSAVAYIRHIGPYAGNHELFDGLFRRLMTWAAAHGLVGDPASEVMCVYHDNPDITEQARLRTSVCITAREDTRPSGEVNLMTVPGGRYAVGRFTLGHSDYASAWASMYGWLPESGHVPDDRPCFEVYDSMAPDAEGRMSIRIFVPVRPL